MKILKHLSKSLVVFTLSTVMVIGSIPISARAEEICPETLEVTGGDAQSDEAVPDEYPEDDILPESEDIALDSEESEEDIPIDDSEIMVPRSVDAEPILSSDDYEKYTSYTADAGSDGCWGDGHYRNLFDTSTFTKWGAELAGTKYVEFHTEDYISPVGYILTTGSDTAGFPNRNPKSWNIYGKKDSSDTEWKLLESIKDDTVLEAKNATPYTYMFNTVDPSEEFKYFRFEVTESKSGNQVQLADFKFLINKKPNNNDLACATISGLQETYDYTGDIIDISYTVTALDGTILEKGKDFKELIDPSPVKEVGHYVLAITGIGNYTGDIYSEFEVKEDLSVASVTTKDGITTKYNFFGDALSYWNGVGDGATLKLLRDIECDYLILVQRGYDDPMILDLNDHGIIFTGESYGATIEVKQNACLELRDDGSSLTTKYITLSNKRGTSVSTDRPQKGELGTDYLEVKGGYITGGYNPYTGEGCLSIKRGKFLMYGGSICGNVCDSFGNINIDYYSKFIMYGGAIFGNAIIANYGSAGVHSLGTFILKGGKIYGNSGSKAHGAIEDSGTIEIETSDIIYAGTNADGFDASVVSAETLKNNLNKYKYIAIYPAPNPDDPIIFNGYASYIPTTEMGKDLLDIQVTFHNRPWYIIKDNSTAINEGTVTLLSVDCFKAMAFGGNDYTRSAVKAYLDSITEENGEFADAADVIDTLELNENADHFNAKLHLLNEDSIRTLPKNVLMCMPADGAERNSWFLMDVHLFVTYIVSAVSCEEEKCGRLIDVTPNEICGVRPALSLKLDKVSFDAATKTFTYNNSTPEPGPTPPDPTPKPGPSQPSNPDSGSSTVDTPSKQAESSENIDSNQKSTKIKKLKAAKQSITVTWKKQAAKGIKGYQIQYSTDETFEKNTKTVTIKKVKTTSKTIKKLKSKKKYYVRIRTYSKKNGNKVYSKWSKSKNVKVK